MLFGNSPNNGDNVIMNCKTTFRKTKMYDTKAKGWFRLLCQVYFHRNRDVTWAAYHSDYSRDFKMEAAKIRNIFCGWTEIEFVLFLRRLNRKLDDTANLSFGLNR